MEGKSVLFKKFAGVECVDLCIDEKDPEKLVTIIKTLHPSFGGINLEDIKGPDCFHVEEELKKVMPESQVQHCEHPKDRREHREAPQLRLLQETHR